jgi:hypothetical protein
LLAATERRLGGCIIFSCDKAALHRELELVDDLEVVLVIALGVPKEKVILEETVDGDVRYYRDENRVHHVPKRALD